MKLEEFDRTKEAVFNPVDIVQNWMGRQAALARFRNRSVSQFFTARTIWIMTCGRCGVWPMRARGM